MLLPGDWIEIRLPREILATLDADQALEGLPFMPEMLPFCGRRFRVLVRAERTCVRGRPSGTPPLRRLEQAVVLEGLRCDGAAHGGCQLGCMYYWKEAWLRHVDEGEAPGPDEAQGPVELRAMRQADPPVYFCQGTELGKATTPAESKWNPLPYLRMLRVRTVTAPALLGMFAEALQRKLERLVRAGRAPAPAAPVAAALGLQPGEWVEVRSKEEILPTLDDRGTCRGLSFNGDMYGFCGRRLRVLRRIETILREDTGELRSLRDTVSLEGADCPGHMGCARRMPLLWREAWLRRVEGS